MPDVKWYLRDEAINTERADAFGHIDFARELKAKIEELGAPLTVALSGTHGTGKSSIGELLSKQFANDARYVFVRIEAWRHEGESRRKAFLYDVIDGLCANLTEGNASRTGLDNLRRGLHATEAHQHAVLDLTGAKESLRVLGKELNGRAAKAAGISALVSAALLVLWYLVTVGVGLRTSALVLWETLPSTLSLPLVVAFLGYFGSLAKQLSEKVLEPAKITVTTAPPASADQFEQTFRKALNLAVSNGTIEKTFVLLIDELDRLAPSEIIEALKAIRTFRDVRPCVFVVALDEEAVKRALIEAEDGVGVLEDSAEAEEFLNKFFKLRQHVPLLVARDMRDFARAVVSGPSQRVSAGIGELTGGNLESVLDALIHRGVETPRHVIRLINSFNGDLRLATVRESGDKPLLARGAISGNLPFLAVMTVLREDYPDFFEHLSRNHDLLNAIDMFLAGAREQAVEEKYPSYGKLCARYFQSAADGTDNGQGDGKPDYANPKAGWSRSLVLYIRATSRFRADGVAPYVYLREDPSARALGSDLRRAIAEEFEAGYTDALRSRFEKDGAPITRAAAQVAVYCLEDCQGGILENVLAACISLFSEFTAEDRERLLDRLVPRLAEHPRCIGRADPSALASLLNEAPDTPYRRRCVDSLLEKFGKPGTRTEEETIRALADHPAILNKEHVAAVQAHVAQTASQLMIQELNGWLDIVRSHSTDDVVVYGLFGSALLLPAAQRAAALPDTQTLPTELTDNLSTAFSAMARRGLAEWPHDYFSAAYALLSSKFGALYLTGFEVIRDNMDHLGNMAAEVVAQLFAETNVPSDADGVERNRELLDLGTRLASHYGANAFRSAQVGLNAYVSATASSPVQEVADAVREHLPGLVGVLGEPYFAAAAETLAASIVSHAGTPPAASALRALLIVPGAVPAARIGEMYDAVTAPLRTGTTDAAAAFGAEALTASVAATLPPDVTAVVTAQVAALLAMVNRASYPPESLTYVARVLDAAATCLPDDQLEAYLQNLAAYIQASLPNQATAIFFAMQRLKVLHAAGLVSPGRQGSIGQLIIEHSQHLSEVGQLELASELTGAWLPSLSQIAVEEFAKMQIDLFPRLPTVAWANVSACWGQLTNAMRASAAVAAVHSPETRPAALAGMADLDRKTTPTDATETLVAARHAPQADDDFLAVAAALCQPLDDQGKNAVATGLFHHLGELPAPSSDVGMLRAACSLTTAANEQGAALFASLLHGDAELRRFALEHLPSFSAGMRAGAAGADSVIEALAGALAVDDAPLAEHNLEVADQLGIADTPAYAAAVAARAEKIEASIRESEEADRGLLKKLTAKRRTR